MANVAQGQPIPEEAAAVEDTTNKKKAKKEKIKKEKPQKEIVQKGKSKKAKILKQKRGVTPLRAALIVTVVFLFLLTAAAALLFFNVAQSRDIALAFLQIGENPYQKQFSELTALQESIRLESAELSQAQQTLDAKEADINKRERDLATRETALSERAVEVDERERVMDDTSTELTRLVAIYEKLDAQTAAKIMTEMGDIDEVVRILNQMKPELVSDVLTAMDAEFAARVSFRMLGS